MYSFFWFPFAWNIFFYPFTFSRVCPYAWSESLVGSMLMGLISLSIHPLCIFWLDNLVHLHLKQLLIGMDLLPFCLLLSGCCVIPLFYSFLTLFLCDWLFSLVVCLDSFSFSFMYCRFLLSGYHEAYMRQLIFIAVYFRLVHYVLFLDLYLFPSPH